MTDSVCYGVRRQPFLPKTFPCRSMTSESPANLGPFCAWRYYHFTSTLPERLRVVPCMVQSCGPQNFDDCVWEWKNSLFSDKFIRSTLLSIIAPNFEPYIPMVNCLVQRLFFCHVAHLVLSFWHEAHRNLHTWTMQASKRGIFTPTMGKATACLLFKDSIWRKRAKTVGHGVPSLGSKIWLDPWVPTPQATKGRRCWCFAHASRGGRVRHFLRDHEHVAQVDYWQPFADVIFSRCL